LEGIVHVKIEGIRIKAYGYFDTFETLDHPSLGVESWCSMR